MSTMPPFKIPEEAVEALALAMRKGAQRDTSKTMVGTTIATAVSVIIAIVIAASEVTKAVVHQGVNNAAVEKSISDLASEVRKGRWSISYEVESWAEFQRKNDNLKLNVPDPYAIRLKIGDTQ